jgi:hypothetical protein
MSKLGGSVRPLPRGPAETGISKDKKFRSRASVIGAGVRPSRATRFLVADRSRLRDAMLVTAR